MLGRAVMGGTFDRLHKGHERLLEEAFTRRDRVVIGLTSDSLVSRLKRRADAESYEKRRESLEDYLRGKGWLQRAEIVRIHTPYGVAPYLPDLDIIVATENTKRRVLEINSLRKESGYPELEVVCVPTVPAEDGKPISSTRIRAGEIDRQGRILRS